MIPGTFHAYSADHPNQMLTPWSFPLFCLEQEISKAESFLLLSLTFEGCW